MPSAVGERRAARGATAATPRRRRSGGIDAIEKKMAGLAARARRRRAAKHRGGFRGDFEDDLDGEDLDEVDEDIDDFEADEFEDTTERAAATSSGSAGYALRRRDARDGGERRREREHEPAALRPRDPIRGFRDHQEASSRRCGVLRIEGESGSGRRPTERRPSKTLPYSAARLCR